MDTKRDNRAYCKSLTVTFFAVLLLAACHTDSERSFFVDAFQHYGQLSTRRIFVPGRNRLPFHYCIQGIPSSQYPSCRLLQLSSSSVDTFEPSAPVNDAQDEKPVNGDANGVQHYVNGDAPTDSAANQVNGGVQHYVNGDAPTDSAANQANGHAPVVNDSAKASVNGDVSANGEATKEEKYPWEEKRDPNVDVPLPTPNGGYSHTSASRAKISAANKGKTPWNKGKARSEETRARIAAGVRAKNRERFLKKIKDMGLTEEEYEEKKEQEKREREAARRARMTENGGYRPTEETKQKISRILKQKWANGEMKERRKIDPSKVRKGFTHTEETRAKISESLRQRWANDPDYRARMVKKSTSVNTSEEVKKRISESLKKRWQEPEFRESMLSKIAGRKEPTGGYGQDHRAKISAAMKKKWQDEEYRSKTVEAMARRREEMGIKPRPKSSTPKRSRIKGGQEEVEEAEIVDGIRVLRPRTKTMKKVKKKAKAKKKVKATAAKATAAKRKKEAKAKKVKGEKKKAEPEGSVTRLREERRDLYDLLYADDDADSGPNPVAAQFALDDENLDDFDPYGLEDY